MTGRVVTLGEVLLRLSPPDKSRFVGSRTFAVNYGGSEANVAVALSQYGVETALLTRLPEHELGDAAIQQLRGFGVDVSHVARGGERLGVYYLENGYSVRPSKVIYDRKNSSMAEAHIDEFDLDGIFFGRDLFHVSGITLGISENSFQLAKAFIEAAKKKGLKVSFDFNYRSKLWSIEEAKTKFEQILDYVDIAFAGHLDFTAILGIKAEKPLTETNIQDYYKSLYRKAQERYSFDCIVSSIRQEESASRNHYQGLMFDSQDIYVSQKYVVDIVDRVGTGDAFTAGFIYSYLAGKDHQYQVEFATASAALKHTIPGDMVAATTDEVEHLFNTREFRVQR